MTNELNRLTPEEAKKIQLQQRENMAIQAKVNAELDDMENKDKDEPELIFNTPQDIYADVLGDDILGGIK